MRKRRLLSVIALASASAVHAAGYDCFVYPLGASTGTVDPLHVVAGQAVGYTRVGSGVNVTQTAQLWTPQSLTPVSLTRTGYLSTVANGTDGVHQVGAATGANGASHAMLWSGSAASYIDLNPTALPGINNSSAISVSGNQQFGLGGNGSTANLHPILWSGTASSAIDLSPTNLPTTFQNYLAEQTDGTNQVGAGCTSGGYSINGWHALLWSGKANTAVDLTPTNYPTLVNSFAFGVGGNQQVGSAYAQVPADPFTRTPYEAMIWSGNGSSAVILNPSNAFTVDGCNALGTNGSQQVGVGYTTANLIGQALLWSGTAASVVNLHNFLPSGGTWNSSTAMTIDAAGVAYGTAVGVFNGTTGSFAAVWTPSTSSSAIIVSAGETYQFSPNTTSKVFSRNISGLTINAAGAAVLPASTNSSNRQLMIISGSGLAIAGLTNNWTGKLDLGNNDLDLVGAPLATVVNQIKQAYSTGTWNGSAGITSSSAAANSRHLTALGVMQNNQNGPALFTASNPFDGVDPGTSDVLVKYTYYGDANLDGTVNSADYTRIDTGYLSKLTGWYNGDFNYDGTVNASDYTLIDNAFNVQAAGLTGQIAQATSQVALPSAVPEPSSTAMFFAIATLCSAGTKVVRRKPRTRPTTEWPFSPWLWQY